MHLAHYNLVRLHKILRVTPAMPAGERLGAAVRAGSEQLRCAGGGRVWGCAFGVGGMLASALVRRVAAAGDGDRQELLFYLASEPCNGHSDDDYDHRQDGGA